MPWHTGEDDEVQAGRRVRTAPVAEGERSGGAGEGHPIQPCPRASPGHVPSPGQAVPKAPRRPGLGVTLCSLPQERARREDKEPARTVRHAGSVLLPRQVTAEPQRDPHLLGSSETQGRGPPSHGGDPPADPAVSCRRC